jgi:hypothetical protein
MVNAVINISEHTNRLLNIVKSRYGLRDKSEAIEKVAIEYEEHVLEPSFKPEFVEELKRVEKHGKFVRIKKVEQLFK